LPAASLRANPVENALLPQAVTELQRLGLSPKQVALDGGFAPGPTNDALTDLQLERLFISGRQQPGCRRTKQVAALPHRRRRTHQPPQTQLRPAPQPPQRRSRPEDLAGWGILTYNLDTLTIRTA
jgi:hypothetical protein